MEIGNKFCKDNNDVKRMKNDGHTAKAIAKYLGVSRATLYRYLDDAPAVA